MANLPDPSRPAATLAGQLASAGDAAHRPVVFVRDRLFAPASQHPTMRRVALGLLVVLGLVHWIWFFGPQALDLDFEDWPKERAYLDVMREALNAPAMPFHMDQSIQMTNRFLSIPETMLAPHVVMLKFLSNTQFITFHACLMFLIGLAGCWQLARRFDWSAFTLLAFSVVFSFNGFITTRLAVGHFMWAGYYLYPWMLLVVLRLLDSPLSTRRIIELSWVIFCLFLLGSFHIAVWWMLFLVVLALARP